jgi:hypothetical protein
LELTNPKQTIFLYGNVTPLECAAAHGHVDAMKLLMQVRHRTSTISKHRPAIALVKFVYAQLVCTVMLVMIVAIIVGRSSHSQILCVHGSVQRMGS